MNVCDRYYNRYDRNLFPSLDPLAGDAVQVDIDSSDLYDTEPAVRSLSDPLFNQTFLMNLRTAATTHIISARDVDANEPHSSSDTTKQFRVTPAAPSQLLVVVPGETAVQGKNTPPLGRTGTPQQWIAGDSFNVTVLLTDDYYNRVFSSSWVRVTTWDPIDSEDANYGPPQLSAGQQQFYVTPITASSSWTVTSVDASTAPTYASRNSSNVRVWPATAHFIRFESGWDPVTISTYATAGSGYNVRANVYDQYRNLCSTGPNRYTGQVAFDAETFANTIQNPTPLPGSAESYYTYTSTDAGSHVFSITLRKSGSRWIKWSDTANSAISTEVSGYSQRPYIDVKPGPTQKIAFTEPASSVDPKYVEAGTLATPGKQWIRAFLSDQYENPVPQANVPVLIDVIDVSGSTGTVRDSAGNVVTSTTTDSNGEIGTTGRELYYHISTKGGDFAKIKLSTGTNSTISGASVKVMTTGGQTAKFAFVSVPAEIEAGAKSSVITIEKRDDFNNPTGKNDMYIGLYSDSPSTAKKFWHQTTDTVITQVFIPGWTDSTLAWPVPSTYSRASFRYSDPYSSWPVGEDGSPNTATAGLTARPSSGKWTLTTQWTETVKGTATVTVNPGAIARLGFDIYPTTSVPLKAGMNIDKFDNYSIIEIETQDSYGNPRPVSTTTVINLGSVSGAVDSLRINDKGFLTDNAKDIDSGNPTTAIGRGYSFSVSTTWVHVDTVTISALNYATTFYYA
ncbi:hypothetical protein KKF45_04290, partial [Patescibacteria group bacterium]|nr:hypothetical protein [Patescibacteria group bacterium]